MLFNYLYRMIGKSLCTWRLQYKKHAKIQYFKQFQSPIFGMWTVLYWTRSSRKQFGVSINVWRLAGDTLNITCNFLYCNRQVHRDFLITLYILEFQHFKLLNATILVAWWSEFLTTNPEVPGSIPGSTMCVFPWKGKTPLVTMVWIVGRN